MVISRASNENFEPKAGLGPLAKFAGPEKGAHIVLLSAVQNIFSSDPAFKRTKKKMHHNYSGTGIAPDLQMLEKRHLQGFLRSSAKKQPKDRAK